MRDDTVRIRPDEAVHSLFVNCPRCGMQYELRIVVRQITCKDCEHYDPASAKNHVFGMGICGEFGDRVKPDEFCSRAEVRTTEITWPKMEVKLEPPEVIK